MQMGYDFNEAMPAGASPATVDGLAAWTRPGSLAGSLAGPLPSGAPGGEGELRQPDWAGLRARFLAMHALRRAVPPAPAAPLPAGGFAASGGSVLSSCRTDETVNPVYWANVKEDSVITGAVAASPTRGDRGMT